MNRKRHFVITFSALLVLGLILLKPESTFFKEGENEECKFLKGNLECDSKDMIRVSVSPNILYKYE